MLKRRKSRRPIDWEQSNGILTSTLLPLTRRRRRLRWNSKKLEKLTES